VTVLYDHHAARQDARVEGAFGLALKTLIKRMRAFHNPYAQRQAAWLEIASALAGERAPAHSQVVGFHEGTLEIAVDSSVWRAELQGFHQASLLARLQADKRAADVVALKFRLGHVEPEPATAKPAKGPRSRAKSTPSTQSTE